MDLKREILTFSRQTLQRRGKMEFSIVHGLYERYYETLTENFTKPESENITVRLTLF